MTLLIERIETSEDLIEALKQTRVERGITQEDVEHAVGLTQGHLGKIEHGGKTWGKQIFRMTPTLVWLMEYFNLALVLTDKDTADKLAGPHVQALSRAHLRKRDRQQHPNAQRMLIRLKRGPE